MTDQNTAGDPSTKDETSNFSSHADQQVPKNDGVNIDEILKRDRHAQEHIRKLENERKLDRERLDNLERELAKAKTIEDLMSWRRQGDYTDNDESTNRYDASQKIDVDALVAKAADEAASRLAARERAQIERDNYMLALNTLKEKYGDHTDSKVDARAKELGVSVQYMAETAKSSPKAFFELMGEKEVRTPPPSSGTTTNLKGTSEPSVDDMLRVWKDPQARKTWTDPDFQKKLRTKILEEYRKKNNYQG